jgi:hypothetical protein
MTMFLACTRCALDDAFVILFFYLSVVARVVHAAHNAKPAGRHSS